VSALNRIASAGFNRVKRAVVTLPSARDWLELAVVILIVGGVAGPIGLYTGLLHYAPRPTSVTAFSALIAIFIPAIGEEIPFRALAIPGRNESKTAYVSIIASTVVFTCWHIFETLWAPSERATFLRPDFLAWAAWLGLWCAILRRRSGSAWPGVILHWLTVVIWIGWLGGPSVVT
jgi:predicted Abi (CAAX) family protease